MLSFAASAPGLNAILAVRLVLLAWLARPPGLWCGLSEADIRALLEPLP